MLQVESPVSRPGPPATPRLRWVSYLSLPRQISDFELAFKTRLNRVAMYVALAHVPVLVALAAINRTGALRALALSSLVALGPLVAMRGRANPRTVSRVFAVAAVGFGGLLVHFGTGPMQIEMHFYFFVALAVMVVFADPVVILVGAGTTIAQHLLVFFLLPGSLLNYRTGIAAVLIHAFFVVLESIGGCFVARTFFDNTVQLERAVEQRTRELDVREGDIRTMLDNAGQGFATFGIDGIVQPARSAVLERWLGPCEPGATVWAWIAGADAEAGAWLELGWQAVVDDVLPQELTLAQLPHRMHSGSRTLELAYRPLRLGGTWKRVMFIVSDVTAEHQRTRLEAEHAELLAMFEGVSRDRAGVVAFLSETTSLLESVLSATLDEGELARALHTLKGNFGTFQLHALAALCHGLEDDLPEDPRRDARIREIVDRWRSLSAKVSALIGPDAIAGGTLHVSPGEIAAVLQQLREGAPPRLIAQSLRAWRHEPARAPLRRLADQASALALRLGKHVRVTIDAGDVRFARDDLGPIWATLGHVIRNAIDHGIEMAEEREAKGKDAQGSLLLWTREEDGDLVLRVVDDGRGVDWDAVRKRGRARGLRTETAADLSDVLFASGITTRHSISEISGRGIGLDAVRTEWERLGGTVVVRSEPGRTLFEARLPLLSPDADDREGPLSTLFPGVPPPRSAPLS